jgi:hypothetical protein
LEDAALRFQRVIDLGRRMFPKRIVKENSSGRTGTRSRICFDALPVETDLGMADSIGPHGAARWVSSSIVATATTAPARLEQLEFHRKGVAALRPRGQRGSAAFVSRGTDDEAALKTCSCSSGRSKKTTCSHLSELQTLVDECHALWRGRSWGDVFQATAWYRLAERLFEADRQPCARVRLTMGGAGLTIHGSDGVLRFRSGALTSATEQLLDRCGVGPGVEPELSRARLLDHLLLLQLTDHERALYDHGMPT